MTIEESNIIDFIPQRHPFVMVDKILFSDSEKTKTNFLITDKNIFVKNGHFREPGMIENIAQTVAAGRGFEGKRENKSPKIGYIGSIKALKIHLFPIVDSTITTEITIQNQLLNFTSVMGKIYVDDKLAAECELVIAVNETKVD